MTPPDTDTMGRTIHEAWGKFVRADDRAGLVTAGAIIHRLARLQADFRLGVTATHDDVLFYRRADLTCPCGDWAGCLLLSDETVHRGREWEPVLGQLEKLTSSVRNHREECNA